VSAPTRQPPSRRRGLAALLRALVALGLLAALLREIELGDALARLGAAKPGFVALALLLMLAEGVCGAYKWWLLLRVRDASIGLWLVVKVSFGASLAACFLPGSVGLELLRGFGVSRSTGDPAACFTSIALDRVAGLVGLLLVLLFGAALAPQPALRHVELLGLGALATLLAGLALAANGSARRSIDPLLRHPRLALLRRGWEQASAVLGELLERRLHVARAVALAVVNTLIRVAVVAAAGAALGVAVPASAYLVVVPLVILAMWLPASLGGFGPREVACVALLGSYGVAGEQALALSLLVGILGLAAELPGVWVLLDPPPAWRGPLAAAASSGRRARGSWSPDAVAGSRALCDATQN